MYKIDSGLEILMLFLLMHHSNSLGFVLKTGLPSIAVFNNNKKIVDGPLGPPLRSSLTFLSFRTSGPPRV